MKSRRYNKKDLKFAGRTAEEADSKLVIQMAIDEKAWNAGYISEDNNALLSRRYQRKCYYGPTEMDLGFCSIATASFIQATASSSRALIQFLALRVPT